MSPLIKKALIVDKASEWNGKVADILIEKGRISKIGKGLTSKGKTIEGKKLCVSPGWIDMKVHFRDPGQEQKEDLTSGLKAARSAGFTSVVTMPSTIPVIDNKAGVDYILNKAKGSGVRIYPAGSLSEGGKGAHLSEMYDMHLAGARLFTDDKRPISDSGLMKKALLYAKNFDGTVSSFPEDNTLSPHASVHEGKISIKLGLEGIPSIAETMRIKRDLDLLRYTDSRLHFGGISTAAGVKLVRDAKKEGLRVTAEVHLANLIWNEEAVARYDSTFKLSPPLRSETDRKALIRGVNNGTIDCISSDHRPQDLESKQVEFGLAETGLSLLENFYPLYEQHLAEVITLEKFVECLTQGPAHVLGFESASIAVGRRAVISCFDRGDESLGRSHSKASNTVSAISPSKGRVKSVN